MRYISDPGSPFLMIDLAGRGGSRAQRHAHLAQEQRVAALEQRHSLERLAVDDLEPAPAVALDQVVGGARSPGARRVVREIVAGSAAQASSIGCAIRQAVSTRSVRENSVASPIMQL